VVKVRENGSEFGEVCKVKQEVDFTDRVMCIEKSDL